MKISVQDSKKVWQSQDGKIKMWDIVLDNGTILQTYSEGIAAGGEFEVETYEKNGKSFVRRAPRPEGQQTSFNRPQGGHGSPGSQERVFKADPVKQESIEWQACLKASVQVVHDWNEIAVTQEGYIFPGLDAYKKQIVEALVTFTQTIEKKPNSIEHHEDIEDNQTMTDQGDFATVDDDRPPLDAYVGMDTPVVDEIPF